MQPFSFINNTNNILINEIWLPITDQAVPGVLPYYSISNYGRVFSYNANRVRAIQKDTNDYFSISLRTIYGEKRINIHRLVMLTFNYVPDHYNYDVNHKDGNKANNQLYNLEWKSHSHNLKHAYDTGLHKRGEEHFASTHTEEQVHIICKGLEDRLPLKQIAINAGLEPNDTNMKFVSSIKYGVVWTHVSDQYNIPSERNNRLFTDDEIHQICKLMEQGLKNDEIISKLGFDLTPSQYNTTMRNIRSRRRFKRISKDYDF